MENKKQITVVIAFIQNEEGKILLQKRLDPLIPDAHEKWEFPGGVIDYGESPEKTLRRECLEETGCEVKIKDLLPIVQSAVWKRVDGYEQHVLIICYEANILKGDPKPLDKKVGQVRWFAKSEIARLDTLKGIEEFIAIAGQG